MCWPQVLTWAAATFWSRTAVQAGLAFGRAASWPWCTCLFSFVCTTLARQRLWQTGRSCHKSWVWMLLYFPGPVTPGIWTPWLVEVDTGSRSSTFQDLDFVKSCQFVSTIQHKKRGHFWGFHTYPILCRKRGFVLFLQNGDIPKSALFYRLPPKPRYWQSLKCRTM